MDFVLTHAQLIQGGVEATISLWNDLLKEDDELRLRAQIAREILFTWMHMKRFHPKDLDQQLVNEINSVVERDKDTLISSATTYDDFLDGFEESVRDFARHCERGYCAVDGDDDFDKLTWSDCNDDCRIALFIKVDDYVLFIAALKKLIFSNNQYLAAYSEKLNQHSDRLKKIYDFFNDNTDFAIFVARPAVSCILESYETDVLKQDPIVFETLVYLLKINCQK